MTAGPAGNRSCRKQRAELTDRLDFAPATPERWAGLKRLFAACGDARGCWCGFWYRPNRDFRAGWGDDNRKFLQRIVAGGAEPGVLAYRDGEAVGWCGIAPREAQPKLARSRVLAPVDEQPVWSITCFVVAKGCRRQGLMRPLIGAALAHAGRQGARIVEAYPIDAQRKLSSGELYVGTPAAFRDLGFVEVARRSPTRPIMRRRLERSSGAQPS
ncbi:MAG: GNAT family N-acetyltransferase [Kiloniellales bacterium]